MHIRIFLFAFILLAFSACKDDETTSTLITDNFDRTAMLTHWADNIIIPGFEDYAASLADLQTATDAFNANPSEATLNVLRADWLEAYKLWQKVSMFDIGKAEAIGLRNFTNIYPTDVQMISLNIETGNYNLELPSNFDTQGFPALDYLLYGVNDDDAAIVATLSQANYAQYLSDIVVRLNDLSNEVLTDWTSNYRDTFIANSASSATGSVDKLVNDFIFYYEKFLRAGKVGIPAGVFSGTPLSTHVEAPYSGEFSKELFDTALDAAQDFFNGKNFRTIQQTQGMSDYLDYLNTFKDDNDLTQSINNQLNTARQASNHLSPNFKQQIETDHYKMLETYDELQKAVVLLKVDMVQAFSIVIDYVDADGD